MLGGAVQAAHDFHLTIKNQAGPLARGGFVKQPFFGFVSVLLALGEKVLQIGLFNADSF